LLFLLIRPARKIAVNVVGCNEARPNFFVTK